MDDSPASTTNPDRHEDVDRVLVSSTAIARRVAELAQKVGDDYAHADGRLTVVPVMTGSLLFAADFVRRCGSSSPPSRATAARTPPRAAAR